MDVRHRRPHSDDVFQVSLRASAMQFLTIRAESEREEWREVEICRATRHFLKIAESFPIVKTSESRNPERAPVGPPKGDLYRSGSHHSKTERMVQYPDLGATSPSLEDFRPFNVTSLSSICTERALFRASIRGAQSRVCSIFQVARPNLIVF
jgi:hypothetical protein